MENITFSINKKFLAGVLTLAALRSLQQDWWGRDETIRRVVDGWVSWKITVPIAIGYLIAALFLCRNPQPEPKQPE